ncbi:ribonuclease 3 [Rhypophila decipiens]|uniref:Ribonuclease 3 n=1 Tax=Rhypophila decipiens TaxID=261697 RepID=A0AAN6YFB6_9PEZI|nr:ribonuclease 3 [Rhypophila decipiens]
MASSSSRSAFASTCKALQQCSRSSQPLSRQFTPASIRRFTSSPVTSSDDAVTQSTQAEAASSDASKERPRWSYTPERMKGAGFSLNMAKDPRRTVWHNNEDPERLDAMYRKLLGSGGEKVLPDEVKWLAITHKSFDQGRRGFNTRLAYFGRQILALESVRAILVSSIDPTERPVHDAHGREPYQHPALANVDKLNVRLPRDIIEKDKVAKLALEAGMLGVIRWKPRMPENLEGSGLTVVLNTAVYAIIGAISLQHGAEVAQRAVREKIIRRLGGV